MQPLASQPFASGYSPGFADILYDLKCSLAVTTYHAGRLILISSPERGRIVQLPRAFSRAMAVGVDGARLAVACRDTVEVLGASSTLAPAYPRFPATYDTVYAPRATYRTGRLDVHGLEWGSGALWAVNTRFSCLATLDDRYSFTPRWRPPFVTGLAPEDRCHLNGFALSDGRPLYATTLGSGDGSWSWRASLPDGGLVVRVPDGEVLARSLPMPHSPRVWDGRLWMLLSATGEVVEVDQATGSLNVASRVDGFARGFDRWGDYLFVGVSRLRRDSFAGLDTVPCDKGAGVIAVRMSTGEIAGELRYENTVEEVFDVRVLAGTRRPGIMGPDADEADQALVTPFGSYWLRRTDGEQEGEPHDAHQRKAPRRPGGAEGET